MKRRKSGFAPPPDRRPETAASAVPLLPGAGAVQSPFARTEGFILLHRPMTLPEPPVRLPPGVTLAPIEAADAGAVHKLMQRAYSSGFGTVPDNLLDWWENLVTDSEFDRNLAVVAKAARHEPGNDVVGFCLCWTSSFVKDLVVDAGWRNRGIGSALLSTAIAALRARGADELALKVNIYNGTAQRLYRQFGFQQD